MFYAVSVDLETTTMDLDSRVTIIEENGNQTVTELEVRVETLEGTSADHETRITANEENIQGMPNHGKVN